MAAPASNQCDSQIERQLVAFWQNEMRVFELPRSGDVSIGRAEGNAIRIEHKAVSRHHAILHIGGELVVEDLGAANGTFVEDRAQAAGETVGLRPLSRQSARIAIGQTVMLGAVTCIVRRAPEPIEGLADPGQRGVVVRDPKMLALYAQAERAALAQITVLILGETGTGKELLARAIHARSPRAKGPFLGVNCAALSESLLESELFGHEKGAFTGATAARPGLFEAAEGGTLLLDEVGELPPATQAKLLRVLEERAVRRIGARAARPIDVRFVAATNRDLGADVAGGRFRQDLYFRLNGITLVIPPLRERPSEIEPLARVFVASACRQLERAEPLDISEDAMKILSGYDWPGSVRELRNAIDHAVVLCCGNTIRPEHLPACLAARVRACGGRDSMPTGATGEPEIGLERFREDTKALERSRILEALKRCDGNQTQAAKLLGISRRTLVSRLGELDVPRPRKPPPA